MHLINLINRNFDQCVYLDLNVDLFFQCVLWQVLPGHIHLPFALQHPQVTLGLSNIIQETMYAQLGGEILTGSRNPGRLVYKILIM